MLMFCNENLPIEYSLRKVFIAGYVAEVRSPLRIIVGRERPPVRGRWCDMRYCR
jgi:hypothetical protein